MKFYIVLLLKIILIGCGSIEEPEYTMEVHPDRFENRQTITNRGGEPVKLGAMDLMVGDIVEFPIGEIILKHADESVAQEVAARWNGEITSVHNFAEVNTPKRFEIRVAPTTAPFDQINDFVPSGMFRYFSSQDALGTYLIVLFEKEVNSYDVSIDYSQLFDEVTELSRKTKENQKIKKARRTQ